jgi:hypothetical protein
MVASPVISGFTSVFSPDTVAVTIDGGTPPTQVAPTVGGTLTPASPLSESDHTIVATVTDAAGNTSTFTQVLTVDT